jgi:hypothetical protein
MIVRYTLKCETCNQPHTVRIGMGQELTQSHKFPCRSCHENITVQMNIDNINISWAVECIENCVPADPAVDAPIVNVDANFLIAPEDQGRDGVFPRLKQMKALIKKAIESGAVFDPSTISEQDRNTRPYRQPDYAEEWKSLKRAWSLARNGKQEISNKQISEASAKLYPHDPMENLENWIWRLSSLACQPKYEQPFLNIMGEIEPLKSSDLISSFTQIYGPTFRERGARYFSIMSEFYAAYSEFGQVYLFVVNDIALPPGHNTSSTDFEAVRMFYGNAYEHFTSLVEILALLNNLLLGRPADVFQTLTLDAYRKLDKPGRFGPFSQNEHFFTICSEADNRIRNASHHGSFDFDQQRHIINYRSGKGPGPRQQMSYVDYQERCVRLFLQVMTLLRVELILSTQLGIKPPV